MRLLISNFTNINGMNFRLMLVLCILFISCHSKKAINQVEGKKDKLIDASSANIDCLIFLERYEKGMLENIDYLELFHFDNEIIGTNLKSFNKCVTANLTERVDSSFSLFLKDVLIEYYPGNKKDLKLLFNITRIEYLQSSKSIELYLALLDKEFGPDEKNHILLTPSSKAINCLRERITSIQGLSFDEYISKEVNELLKTKQLKNYDISDDLVFNKFARIVIEKAIQDEKVMFKFKEYN